ncbi:MAG: PadR family transcriptional regulator [Pseudonocardia sp.]
MRIAVLALLAEEPMHGYRIIQEITERSNGLWRPSPGSVYPMISQLEDEGLVTLSEGARTARLTAEGRAYASKRTAELEAVWTSMTDSAPAGIFALRDQIDRTRSTLFQLMQSGSEDQLARAEQVFAEACRALNEILAEDASGDDPES